MGMTGKWKYWVGHLILDQGGQGYPRPGANGPVIDRPAYKADSTTLVSDRSHYGILTTDMKQVEWYVAQYRAWGFAIYFEDLHSDNDDAAERPPVFSRGGEFIGFLHDACDAERAQSELGERDRRAAERCQQRKAAAVKEAQLRETVKTRCAKYGCTMRVGYGCPRSEHKHGGCVELSKHFRKEQ
jgi:hypothetical protein